MFKATLRQLYSLERETRYPLYRMWVLGPVWTGAENLALPPTWIRSPDCPASNQSLYWLSYPVSRQYKHCPNTVATDSHVILLLNKVTLNSHFFQLRPTINFISVDLTKTFRGEIFFMNPVQFECYVFVTYKSRIVRHSGERSGHRHSKYITCAFHLL
jgi:hypothetical protein